ncbi:MAG: succinate--CoA ligase subunit alpha [Armatimonadetes bacterium]|nr:succinate--CoA ligase subunit alpha [Armatimonadota bacterium]
MAILVDASSRILIQGITGATGRSFAGRMVENRSGLVGGVTPGRGGQVVAGVPVFDTVDEAVARTAATHSLIVVPPAGVLDAVMEAADAGIRLAVVYTEGAPVWDTLRARAYAHSRGMMLCGPNSAGIASPGKANLSDLNDANLAPGSIGIVSRSGTLTYEVILELRRRGLGTSTVVCLGGDPIVGLHYGPVLEGFDADPETEAVVLIGEIGGGMETDAVPLIRRMRKPVVGYIAGWSAPPAKKMGHAGAIVQDRTESAEAKTGVLTEAGVRTARLLLDVAPMVEDVAGARRRPVLP